MVQVIEGILGVETIAHVWTLCQLAMARPQQLLALLLL